jgi:hypothetical protein
VCCGVGAPFFLSIALPGASAVAGRAEDGPRRQALEASVGAKPDLDAGRMEISYFSLGGPDLRLEGPLII